MYQRASTTTSAHNPTSQSSNRINHCHSLQPTLRFQAALPNKIFSTFSLGSSNLHSGFEPSNWIVFSTYDLFITRRLQSLLKWPLKSAWRAKQGVKTLAQVVVKFAKQFFILKSFLTVFTTFSNPASPCTKPRPAQQPSVHTVSFLRILKLSQARCNSKVFGKEGKPFTSMMVNERLICRNVDVANNCFWQISKLRVINELLLFRWPQQQQQVAQEARQQQEQFRQDPRMDPRQDPRSEQRMDPRPDPRSDPKQEAYPGQFASLG